MNAQNMSIKDCYMFCKYNLKYSCLQFPTQILIFLSELKFVYSDMVCVCVTIFFGGQTGAK